MNSLTSSNSVFNISSDSTFFQNSPTNSKTYDIKLLQTWNLDAVMHLLDNWEVFTNMTQLDGRTAFHCLLTLDHLHSTIWRMEQEIWIQKAKAMIILNQLIKEKSSKQLQQYFWQNPQASQHDEWKFTPLISLISSSSSFAYPEPKQPLEPPLVPPLGTKGNPIVIDNDESDVEFPRRNGSGCMAQIVDNWDKPFDMALACQMCGLPTHITQRCHTGLVQDQDTGFWYSPSDYGCCAQSVEVWA